MSTITAYSRSKSILKYSRSIYSVFSCPCSTHQHDNHVQTEAKTIIFLFFNGGLILAYWQTHRGRRAGWRYPCRIWHTTHKNPIQRVDGCIWQRLHRKELTQLSQVLSVIPLLRDLAHKSLEFDMVPFPHLATGGEQGCPILVLKKAQQAGKQPDCEYWGITFSGRNGFAVYKNGKLVERYVAAFI